MVATQTCHTSFFGSSHQALKVLLITLATRCHTLPYMAFGQSIPGCQFGAQPADFMVEWTNRLSQVLFHARVVNLVRNM